MRPKLSNSIEPSLLVTFAPQTICMNLTAHYGEMAALATALFWTVTSLSFEQASKLAGSLTVNLFRLFLALLFYMLLGLIVRSQPLPMDAPAASWAWLSLSGLIGFVLGDYFLFRAFTLVGARISMLVMALAPPIAALTGWIILGERLSLMNLIGMTVTLSGITLVVLERAAPTADSISNGIRRLAHSPKGILFAMLGAVGQGVGLVLSKLGMGSYDAFASSQIRVIAGLTGFLIVFSLLRRWKHARLALASPKAMKFIFIGAIFGPFLGVAFSLLSVKHTSTGIASTIMAIVPVLIIPFSYYLMKEAIRIREIIGAVLAVAGVSLFFLF